MGMSWHEYEFLRNSTSSLRAKIREEKGKSMLKDQPHNEVKIESSSQIIEELRRTVPSSAPSATGLQDGLLIHYLEQVPLTEEYETKVIKERENEGKDEPIHQGPA
jgi:hypothetical protein